MKNVLRYIPLYKTEIIFATLVGLIIACGYALSKNSLIDITPLSPYTTLPYILAAIVISVLLFILLLSLKQLISNKKHSIKETILPDYSDRKLWLVISVIIFCFYLPVIVFGVSVATPDSWNSISQITGGSALSGAHPIIFTLFLGFFIKVGLIFDSLQLGLILFSIAQSTVIAIIFARVIVWMRAQGLGKWPILATLAFYAVLPVNAVAGIIIWKDVLFAGFGLLLLMSLRDIYVNKGEFNSKKSIALFVIFAFLFCVWRNNGLYVYILFAALAVVLHYRLLFKKTTLIAILAAPIILAFVYTGVTSVVTSNTTSTAESLSVPLQQIARVVKYHGDTLSDTEKRAIDEILPYDKLSSLYNPSLSDPVKSSFDVEVFKINKAKYVKLWLRLLIDYPRTFVLSFVYNFYGYLYPFYESSTTTDILMDNEIHFNAPPDYKDTPQVLGYKSILSKYKDILMSAVPLLNNIGFYVCIVILCLYVAIIRRKKELIGVFIVLAGLFITTILGPVNSEFRYLYLFVVATPFLVSSVYIPNISKRRS